MKHWSDSLTNAPCTDALAWLGAQPDAQTAWDKSERGDWMLYHAGKLAGEPGSAARRPLVLAACVCARLALPYVRKGELRPLAAIETAERWARGGADAPSLKQVRAAARAAYAAYAAYDIESADTAAYAAYAAARAAYAAPANAACAAEAAAYAAADAARAAAARQCVDIVRKHYPKVPK